MRPQFKQHSVCHFTLKPCISGFAFDIFQLYHSQDMSKAIGNIMFSRNIANCLHLQCFKIRNDTTQSSEAFCALCTYVNEKPFIASDCCLVLPLIHVTRLNDPLLASSFTTGFFYQASPISGKIMSFSLILDFGLSKNCHSILSSFDDDYVIMINAKFSN